MPAVSIRKYTTGAPVDADARALELLEKIRRQRAGAVLRLDKGIGSMSFPQLLRAASTARDILCKTIIAEHKLARRLGGSAVVVGQPVTPWPLPDEEDDGGAEDDQDDA